MLCYRVICASVYAFLYVFISTLILIMKVCEAKLYVMCASPWLLTRVTLGIRYYCRYRSNTWKKNIVQIKLLFSMLASAKNVSTFNV